MPSINKKNLLMDMKFPLFRKTIKEIGHWKIPVGLDFAVSEELPKKILSEIADEDIFGTQALEASIIQGLKNLDQFDVLGNPEHQIHDEKPINIWVRAAQAYWIELSELPAEELEKRFEIAEAEKRQREDRNAFFNHPSSQADFSYWILMPHWQPEEAVALSMGKEPRMVTEKTLKDNLSRRLNRSVFAQEFFKRKTHIRRAQDIGDLGKHIDPTSFRNWTKRHNWNLHEGFEAALKSCEESRQPLILDKKIQGKTLNTYLQIIYGLAIIHYDQTIDLYSQEKSTAARRISEDLFGLGIEVDPKTVRKYLQDAQKHLRGGKRPLKKASPSSKKDDSIP
jgi:hypothetical protein